MSASANQYQATHEVGRVYDAILDRNILAEFFLTTLLRFIPARQSYLFLAVRNKTLLLETSIPPIKKVVSSLAAEAQKMFEEGKPCASKHRMFLPLIVRNSILGIACLERAADASAFTPQEVETGFDLASEFSGALKNSRLFEENLKMERLAAVGQAIGMMIHEIRNIMQLGRFSDEMIRMGLEEKNETYLTTGLSKMAKTLKEMDTLVGEMLGLTKDYRLEPERVDLAAIFSELQSDLTERAERTHIKLDFKTDPDFPEVEGDGRSLYRALLNLAKNAFEAFQNKAEACIKIRARIKDDEHYELSVEDNASGMSKEVKAKLFETFFSTKGKHGTGLGLMIVARTAKMHQGTVSVESQPGVGTKFILTLWRSFPKVP
jgi:signal transduction histidine kinase